MRTHKERMKAIEEHFENITMEEFENNLKKAGYNMKRLIPEADGYSMVMLKDIEGLNSKEVVSVDKVTAEIGVICYREGKGYYWGKLDNLNVGFSVLDDIGMPSKRELLSYANFNDYEFFIGDSLSELLVEVLNYG